VNRGGFVICNGVFDSAPENPAGATQRSSTESSEKHFLPGHAPSVGPRGPDPSHSSWRLSNALPFSGLGAAEPAL
jgi:hypothetical protein